MHGMDWGFGGGWMMVLWWIVIIVGVYSLIRWFSRREPPSAEESALEILRKRYARGDISKTEFEEKKKALL